MRDRIILQKKKKQTGAVVNLDGNYEDYKTVWAKIEYFSSKEIYSAQAINVLDTVKFIIRFRKDVTHDMRIKFDNNVYEIKGIRPFGYANKQWLMIVSELIKHE